MPLASSLPEENLRRQNGGKAPDLVYLADNWKWFGQYTGYAQLAQGMASDAPTPHIVQCSSVGILKDLRNRAYAFSHRGAWCCAGRDRQSERAFITRLEQHPHSIGHVLYFERHHPLFRQWRRAPAGIITTIHHAPRQMEEWHPAILKDLRRVTSAIVMYQRDLEFFQHQIGRDRVRFVPHGVDTEFFQPGGHQFEGLQRLLFIGVNGRNLVMLERVVQRLSRTHPALRFDLLLPRLRDKPREALKLRALWRNPHVSWHSNLSDEALRALYQTSYLLLLPLEHAGACNTIVEALACGLPVVTTDVGGVRDYGAGAVYPVIANNDDDAMIELVQSYLESPERRRQISSSCRRFAEETLSWPKVRQRHLEIYAEFS